MFSFLFSGKLLHFNFYAFKFLLLFFLFSCFNLSVFVFLQCFVNDNVLLLYYGKLAPHLVKWLHYLLRDTVALLFTYISRQKDLKDTDGFKFKYLYDVLLFLLGSHTLGLVIEVKFWIIVS